MTDLEAATVAAGTGDHGALETVYRALAPTVRGYLAVHGSRDPDGLTTEVFLQLIPLVPRVDNGWEGLRTLTFSIAHARLVDEQRAALRRPASERYDGERDGRTAPSAELHALDRVATAELADVLGLLPELHRTVVVLRVLADLSVRQTAEVVGLPEHTVKKAHSRGLAALRRLLATDSTTDDRQQGQ